MQVAIWARTAAMLAIAIWSILSTEGLQALYYVGICAAFTAFGWLPRLLCRSDNIARTQAILTTVDALLLTWVLIVPSPFIPDVWTALLNMRFQNFGYYFVYLGLATLTFSPLLVIWAGVAAALAWSAGFWILFFQPDTINYLTPLVLDPARSAVEQDIARTLGPHYLSVLVYLNQIVVLLLATGLLAVAVWRGRRLLMRSIQAEVGKANLARYFPPEVAESLAAAPAVLNEIREQHVAIIFMDIIGFTSLSEKMTAVELMGLLREYHTRVSAVVFRHGGVMEKFIGDAVKITYGAPHAKPDDAARALICAHALLEEMSAWSDQRRAAGQKPVAVGIGLHYGLCAVGNLGDGRSLEYQVVGDCVNVASRLEQLTREHAAPIVASHALISAATADPRVSEMIPRYQDGPAIQVRNRREPVEIRLFRAA
ncbi:adenylate/guanylate cyclase domain-containing protein [Lacibacterium aquatile]|uniref:Adenylate/guanylate cyclase domain-containing protein n=1 Tax=Lacibacterium aquatile TaxID=1168082 RepID=A0ABW5E0J5_9PROT